MASLPACVILDKTLSMNAIKRIAGSKIFDQIIIGLILLTAVLIAVEAFPSIMTPLIEQKLNLGHNIILGLFIIEAIIKIIAESPRPWNYFKSGWNIFDFSLIVLALLPISGEYAMLGRVFRLSLIHI